MLCADLFAVTPVSGPISAPTLWTSENSPYVVTGTVTINAGITLTIEEGTVVKFYYSNVAIDVNGSLIVNGTSAEPVIFTDFRDDTAGGDINDDDPETSPGPGAWRGIAIYDGGSATIEYADIRYAGWWNYSTVPANGIAVYKTGTGNFSISHSIVRNIANYWWNSIPGM